MRWLQARADSSPSESIDPEEQECLEFLFSNEMSPEKCFLDLIVDEWSTLFSLILF